MRDAVIDLQAKYAAAYSKDADSQEVHDYYEAARSFSAKNLTAVYSPSACDIAGGRGGDLERELARRVSSIRLKTRPQMEATRAPTQNHRKRLLAHNPLIILSGTPLPLLLIFSRRLPRRWTPGKPRARCLLAESSIPSYHRTITQLSC